MVRCTARTALSALCWLASACSMCATIAQTAGLQKVTQPHVLFLCSRNGTYTSGCPGRAPTCRWPASRRATGVAAAASSCRPACRRRLRATVPAGMPPSGLKHQGLAIAACCVMIQSPCEVPFSGSWAACQEIRVLAESRLCFAGASINVYRCPNSISGRVLLCERSRWFHVVTHCSPLMPSAATVETNLHTVGQPTKQGDFTLPQAWHLGADPEAGARDGRGGRG